ncbi:MAG: hypothetical protein SF051_02085 [Elusimicrobiota bacterium]|nr:hypothetical protein [Elusimicrobiota bacterium]
MQDSRELVRAFSAVVAALAPLDPESRRRVIEAVHSMLPIGAGRGQGGDRAGARAPAKRRR